MADEQQKDLIQPILTPPQKGETQEVAPPEATLKIVKWDKTQRGLEEYQMTEAVQQALDAGIIRSQAAKYFLPALCQLRETDLRDARAERNAAQTSIDKLRDNYHAEHTSRAVLEERLHGEVRVKRLQNVFITLGGILVGCGFAPLITMSSPAIIALTVMGIVMLAVGWFYPENRRDKQ